MDYLSKVQAVSTNLIKETSENVHHLFNSIQTGSSVCKKEKNLNENMVNELEEIQTSIDV